MTKDNGIKVRRIERIGGKEKIDIRQK